MSLFSPLNPLCTGNGLASFPRSVDPSGDSPSSSTAASSSPSVFRVRMQWRGIWFRKYLHSPGFGEILSCSRIRKPISMEKSSWRITVKVMMRGGEIEGRRSKKSDSISQRLRKGRGAKVFNSQFMTLGPSLLWLNSDLIFPMQSLPVNWRLTPEVRP